MINAIASSSSLTREQVTECFETLRLVLIELVKSRTRGYIDDKTKIYLPKVGYFYFRKLKGAKKGTKYICPVGTTGRKTEKILDKDRPDRYILHFKVIKSINDFAREELFKLPTNDEGEEDEQS